MKQNLLSTVLAMGIALTVVAGCGKKDDPIAQAEKKDKDKPGIAETKAIAEEGFIYGLPIVMNYAVMYEYAVDKNSGQFKAPFNEINNEARVFTYKDTAVVTPNSDTPYSMLWLDLRAEPMVLSVPAVEKSRYYSVMLCDGNTFNYGYIGSRATGNDRRRLLVVGPDWKGETPAGIKKVFRSSTQFSAVAYRTQLFNAKDMPNVVKVQSGYKAQPLSAYLKQPAPPAAPAINFPKIDKDMVKTNFFEYLDFALQFAPAGPGGKGDPREARPHRHRRRQDLRLQGSLPRAQGRGSPGDEGGRRRRWSNTLPPGKRTSTVGRLARSSATALSTTGDWLKRAAAAKGGIYGNDAVEAMYPMTKTLANGEDARRQQAQLHADLRQGSVPAGKCLLVGDDVRRQDAAPDRESDQSLPDQLTDAAGNEKESGRIADALHPEGLTGQGEGSPTGCRRPTARSIW